MGISVGARGGIRAVSDRTSELQVDLTNICSGHEGKPQDPAIPFIPVQSLKLRYPRYLPIPQS